MDDGEPTNSETTLDVRVATVQNDVTHLMRHVDQVEGSVVQTRDELKSDMRDIRDELKSDIEGVETRLSSAIAGVAADLKDGLRDLRSDMRTEMGHDRKVLYAFCGTAIVSMIALLAKGVLY